MNTAGPESLPQEESEASVHYCDGQLNEVVIPLTSMA